MDLSSKLLRDIEFREQWRGYSPNEVDEFLEQAAAALDSLQERLRESTERAARAERQLLERADDDELRRTLVLAQRTADAAVAEAEQQARTVVSEAEERARQLVADAEGRAVRLDADAAARVSDELGSLGERRAALEDDVEVLRDHAEQLRSKMQEDLVTQLAWLESTREDQRARPLVSATVVPVGNGNGLPAAPMPAGQLGELGAGPDRSDEVGGPLEPTGAYDVLVDEARSEAVRGADVVTDREPPAVAVDGTRGNDTGDVPVVPVVIGTDDAIDVREAPVSGGNVGADEDDPFLAELRRAVTDSEPLGPRAEGDDGALYDQDVAAAAMFRRRRRH